MDQTLQTLRQQVARAAEALAEEEKEVEALVGVVLAEEDKEEEALAEVAVEGVALAEEALAEVALEEVAMVVVASAEAVLAEVATAVEEKEAVDLPAHSWLIDAPTHCCLCAGRASTYQCSQIVSETSTDCCSVVKGIQLRWSNHCSRACRSKFLLL